MDGNAGRRQRRGSRGCRPREVGGLEVPVAVGLRARLLGLAGLEREQAGPGLLIPRCSSVHTFGMRFALDLVFLDRRRRALASAARSRRAGCASRAAAISAAVAPRRAAHFGGETAGALD